VIALALLALAQSASAEDDSIEVVGRRLAQTRGMVWRDSRTRDYACKVRVSSGDAAVDGAVCQIAVSCARTKKRGMSLRACVDAGRQNFLDTTYSRQADHAQN
jgi:hypothetical protein